MEIIIEDTIVEIYKDKKLVLRIQKGIFNDALKNYGLEVFNI